MCKKYKIILTMLFMVFQAGVGFSQGIVKGLVVDASNNEPLPGASVYVDKTTTGTVTTVDGLFELKVQTPNPRLVFRFIGYEEVTMDLSLADNQTKDLGTISLQPSAIGMEEVYVTASFVRDRATPIAVSTIEPQLIVEKLGNQEFPEILKSTPSIYATKAGGGFGDARTYVRGFDSDNVGVLINGIPVNGMENGKVYWSNWAGLSDVTQSMQVQRGLGATRLALSTVGGTINIVTKSTEAKAGGTVYLGMGNDGYMKQTFSLSTGLFDNGWALTVAGGHTYGDGYVQATNFEGWSYFVNISKKIGERHRITFNAFGAPQWHNQRNNMHPIQDWLDNPHGLRWNTDFGYRNGKVYNTAYAYNYYHKPQISLNHYWTINENMSLSTQIYGSISSGGGRRVYGANQNWITYDHNTGLPYSDTKLTSEGLLDYDYVIDQNANAVNGSTCIIANGINDHQWYGLLSTYTANINKLKITAGLDARFYSGVHAYEIDDLLGGKYFLDVDGKGRSKDKNRANKLLKKGDYVNYNYRGQVFWAGLFVQGEYVTDRYSAFLSLSAASNNYRRVDFFNYKEGEQVSDLVSSLPMTVKGGFNFRINPQHFVFVNGGYITKAPILQNSFLNYQNDVNKDAKMEQIITAEVGYGFDMKPFEAYLNLFWTRWNNKGLVKKMGDEVANITGINAQHMGLEFEATYRPFKTLKIKAMASVGDYRWADNVNFTLYNQNQDSVGAFNAYIADVHVGNSAQITAALNVDYTVLPKLKIGVDCNYYGKNFADFDPTKRTKVENGGDAWKLPDVFLLDLNANYNFRIGKLNATIYGNVHNLLDTHYIADASDGVNHDELTSIVYFALGRTWSAGIRINF